MANIKSAEKRNRQAPKRTARNRIVRGSTRTAIKKARTAIESNDATSVEAVKSAIQTLDRAATKGVIHKNNAARRKSRLMQALNKLQAAA
ncbi:MAG: 30S ribosomal protein S20 [Caldilineaceae bacterium]|nr:30S ribosomal protein S20 [Caldilineaceae bacterium]